MLGQVCKTIVRTFHTSQMKWAAEKSQLAKLRKMTGYTFVNCKKALEMHDNDIIKAQAWLKEQAQQLGWAKATKLEGRQTAQGLIAISIKKNNGVLLELNCETDFVARNEVFQSMADTGATAVLKFSQNQPLNGQISKIGLDMEQLKQLPANDGKSLSDHLALMIGTIGENASLNRAFCLKVDNDSFLSGYVHPSGVYKNQTLLGRIGGLVVLKQIEKREDVDIEETAKGICQHIVGMNPKKIGTSDDEPSKNSDDEICLIHQQYLLDEEATVKEVLESSGLEVVDFKRFECGETENVSDSPLEFVETCQ